MTPRHVFEDEWLTRAAATLPAAASAVEKLRAQNRPHLFDALLAEGAASEDDLRAAVKTVFRVSPLLDETPDRPAAALVPEKMARRYRLVPVKLYEETIEIAMENPLDLEALNDVQAVTGRSPVPLHARHGQIDSLFAQVYSPDSIVHDLVQRLDSTDEVEVLDEKDHTVGNASHGPVVRLVNSLIAKAFHMRASDIHLEHDEKSSVVRFRIDGALKNIMTLPRFVGAGPLVARLKIMADLDIADRLRPQDGRAKLRVGVTEIGLRVSTLPTNFGEKVVIRILDKRSAEVPFEKLGFRPDLAERMGRLLGAAQGVILVTGPTGSGKTTTLYSILNRLKSEDTNIVTVEDPVEYKIEGINQTQVQEKQGLTFAAVLRSVLRQDPDVILVGEIRDRETAETAMQAALTGHLVVSSLHTNDALSTVARLVDMGIERFKLAPALIAITAQRLVRSLCACKAPAAVVDPALAAALESRGLPAAQWTAKGCASCDFTGFRGRTSVVELLEMSEGLKKRLAAGESDAQLKEFALGEKTLSTLADDALWHVSRGDTTLEEILPYAPLPGAEAASPRAPVRAAAPVPVAVPEEIVPASSVTAPASKGPSRVLIADDDGTIRIILRKVLETQGFVVAEAADGPSALAAVASAPPDLLMVDLNMPGLDGYGVIRGVRESLGLTRLPIIMLTADSDDKSQSQALELGADDYIIKPVKVSVVVARVKAAFRRAAV